MRKARKPLCLLLCAMLLLSMSAAALMDRSSMAHSSRHSGFLAFRMVYRLLFPFPDRNGTFSRQFDCIISDYDNHYKHNFVNLS